MGYLTWSIDVSSAQAFGEINIYPLVDGAVNYLAFQCRKNRIIQSLQGNCLASHKLWQTLVNLGWKFMTQMHVPSFSRGSHETVLPRLTGQLVLRVFIVQDNSHFFIYPAHLTLPSSRKCKTTCVWIPSDLFFTNGIISVSWGIPMSSAKCSIRFQSTMRELSLAGPGMTTVCPNPTHVQFKHK